MRLGDVVLALAERLLIVLMFGGIAITGGYGLYHIGFQHLIRGRPIDKKIIRRFSNLCFLMIAVVLALVLIIPAERGGFK